MAFIDLPWLLQNATYGLIVALLVLAGLGLPVPEDVVLLAAGALIHRGTIALVPAGASVAVGVIVGDLVIFLMARHLGVHALDRPLIRKILPERRRQRLERLFERWGGAIVFAARHVAGIRAPVFALAGMHKYPIALFVVWDMAGLCISAPLVMGLGYLFSDRVEEGLRRLIGAEHLLIVVVVGLLAGYATYIAFRRWREGRNRA